jgi:hypothetical protein
VCKTCHTEHKGREADIVGPDRNTLLGGYAVDYGGGAYSTERPLYGVNAEVSVAGGKVELVPFYVEQRANGLLDRRAVGLESRFFSKNASVFSLVDYDIYHEALNTTYLMANLRFGTGWSAYANFDHRRSPYITTENALIGQGSTTSAIWKTPTTMIGSDNSPTILPRS